MFSMMTELQFLAHVYDIRPPNKNKVYQPIYVDNQSVIYVYFLSIQDPSDISVTYYNQERRITICLEK